MQHQLNATSQMRKGSTSRRAGTTQGKPQQRINKEIKNNKQNFCLLKKIVYFFSIFVFLVLLELFSLFCLCCGWYDVVCLFVCLLVCLFVCLFFVCFGYVCLFFVFFVCLFVCLFVCSPSVCFFCVCFLVCFAFCLFAILLGGHLCPLRLRPMTPIGRIGHCHTHLLESLQMWGSTVAIAAALQGGSWRSRS